MPPNPYAPPTADVADPNPGWPPPPRAVVIACRLVLASLVLGILSLLPGMRPALPDDPVVPWTFTLAIVIVFGGLTLWLVLEVWRGKAWARWALLAFLALGWWLGAGELSNDFLRSPLLGLLDVVNIAMEMAACGLLFFGDGARWFAAVANRRRAPGHGAN